MGHDGVGFINLFGICNNLFSLYFHEIEKAAFAMKENAFTMSPRTINSYIIILLL
jgi:hypothetical protein